MRLYYGLFDCHGEQRGVEVDDLDRISGFRVVVVCDQGFEKRGAVGTLQLSALFG